MKLSLLRHGMALHKNVNFRLIAPIQCCETAGLHIWENLLTLFDLKDMRNKHKSYFLHVTRMTTSFLYNSKHSRLHMHFDHSSRNRNSACWYSVCMVHSVTVLVVRLLMILLPAFWGWQVVASAPRNVWLTGLMTARWYLSLVIDDRV